MKLGSSDVSKLYFGSTEISKAYLGSNTVYAPAAGFDPTLGGTLSPSHWWDFTDQANLVLSGTDITEIGDKGNSATPETISVANGWTFYSSNPQYNNGAALFNGASPLYKTANWSDDMVATKANSTWLMIAKLDPLADAVNGLYAITGNRTGWETLHQGMAGRAYRVTNQNTNNGATTNNPPQLSVSNKSGVSYGSYYAETDPKSADFMFTVNIYNSISGQTAFETSLDGLPFGGLTPTYTESTSNNGYIAIGGSGLEVTFGRQTNFAWHGWISHIIAYHNTHLTDAQIAAIQATR